MRLALLSLVLLAGCPVKPTGGECMTDDQCDGQVCGRDGTCADSSSLRSVKAIWTINGAAPDVGSCTGRELYISFQSDDATEDLDYAPVPCPNGQFVVDKLPKRYTRVELGVNGSGVFDSAVISTENEAVLDLAF